MNFPTGSMLVSPRIDNSRFMYAASASFVITCSTSVLIPPNFLVTFCSIKCETCDEFCSELCLSRYSLITGSEGFSSSESMIVLRLCCRVCFQTSLAGNKVKKPGERVRAVEKRSCCM